MTLDEIEKRIPELRDLYMDSALPNRLNVIRKKLTHAKKAIGPDRLVLCVSGVEAFARAQIIHWGHPDAEGVRSQYEKWRKSNPEALLKQVARLCGKGPAKNAFDQWDHFKVAVAARNLIVHECTFFGQDKYPVLITACESVLAQMTAWAGLNEGTDQEVTIQSKGDQYGNRQGS